MKFDWSIQITWKMYSCCKTQIFAGTTTPKLINTSADRSDQSFLLIWADKSFFISSGQVVYFQTVSSHSQKFFKIGFLKNFVKHTKMYLCRSLSLSTLHHAAFLKRESDTVTLLWILWIFLKTTFLQNTSAASVFLERISNINKSHFI